MPRSGDVDEEKRATLRRFAAIGAATPFAGGAGADEDDDSNVRSAIVGYLGTTPGAHFSKIRDDLGIGTGAAQHHLRALAEDDVIESTADGSYRRYFRARRFSAFEKTVLGTLRRETRRQMVLELLHTPDLSGTELAEEIGFSRPTVSNHASDLIDCGVIEHDDGYRVRQPETVITLLVRYADSFGEDATAFAGDVAALITYDP